MAKVYAADITLPGYSGTGFKFGNNPEQVGLIISELLKYILVFAGLSLLVMLIWGGITLMSSAGNPDKAKEGYGKITGALIGFLIIFITFFVAQLLEVALGVNIL